MSKIIVKDTEINIIKVGNEDYICITDMIKAKDGDFFITDWLRNRNTLEYIGVWESLYNSNFNYGEFAIIKSKSGLNNFKISVKEFVEKTNAISLQAKPGRYGGTYAHKDIALEFGMWISAEFKIYLVREYQRLKKEENNKLGWSVKRELTKINYSIHTNAINQYTITSTKSYTILFSNPITTSRFLKPISVSTNTTFLPSIAKLEPKFAVVVVFPTPPFPDVITSTSPINLSS